MNWLTRWMDARRAANCLRLRQALLVADRPMSGYELARAAHVTSAFAYMELTRLMGDGTVVDGWSLAPDWGGRRRRFYMLADRASWAGRFGLVPYEEVR